MSAHQERTGPAALTDVPPHAVVLLWLQAMLAETTDWASVRAYMTTELWQACITWTGGEAAAQRALLAAFAHWPAADGWGIGSAHRPVDIDHELVLAAAVDPPPPTPSLTLAGDEHTGVRAVRVTGPTPALGAFLVRRVPGSEYGWLVAGMNGERQPEAAR